MPKDNVVAASPFGPASNSCSVQSQTNAAFVVAGGQRFSYHHLSEKRPRKGKELRPPDSSALPPLFCLGRATLSASSPCSPFASSSPPPHLRGSVSYRCLLKGIMMMSCAPSRSNVRYLAYLPTFDCISSQNYATMCLYSARRPSWPQHMPCHARAVDPAVPDWDLVPVHTPHHTFVMFLCLYIFARNPGRKLFRWTGYTYMMKRKFLPGPNGLPMLSLREILVDVSIASQRNGISRTLNITHIPRHR